MANNVGRPRGKEQKINLNVRITAEVQRRLVSISEKKGTTPNQEALKMILRGCSDEYQML